MPSSYRLVMRSGPSAGKVHPLEKNELFIGRDLNNDVVINDPEVSRRHARLYAQGNSYVLEDLGSTNGTFVGGQRLTGPYPLRIGEVITFGERMTVVFEMEQDEDATVVSSSSRQAYPSQPPQQMPVQQVPVQSQAAPPPYQPQRQTAPLQPPLQQPVYVSQAPLQVDPVYAGQVPYQAPIEALPARRSNRTLIIVLIALLVVVCLCVAAGLYFAPKSFWCVFPIWPAGACP